MAIVCRKCGRPSADGVEFCANADCGAYLGWDGMGQPGPVRAGTPERSPTEAQHVAGAVTLSASELAAVPGETVTTTATVHNGGSQVEQFAVTVVGPTAGWAVVSPATMQVYPGERGECVIRWTPPRVASTAPGRAWFILRVTSTLHPGLTVEARGVLNVGAFRELTAALAPQHSSGRGPTTHRVELTNAGNGIETVKLQAVDPTGRFQFGLPTEEVPVPPGPLAVLMAVRVPRRTFGRRQLSPFQVTVTPRQPLTPIRLDGNRQVVPFFGGWMLLLTVLMLLLVFVVCCGIFNAYLH